MYQLLHNVLVSPFPKRRLSSYQSLSTRQSRCFRHCNQGAEVRLIEITQEWQQKWNKVSPPELPLLCITGFNCECTWMHYDCRRVKKKNNHLTTYIQFCWGPVALSLCCPLQYRSVSLGVYCMNALNMWVCIYSHLGILLSWGIQAKELFW